MRFLAPLFALLTACSSYKKDFRAAADDLPQPPPNALGPWQGEWLSKHNGHKGPLWCVISQPEQEGRLDFRYRAGWAWIRFGDYHHKVETTLNGDGSIDLSADMELPGGFGTYSVEGKITATRFDATYKSANGDHGTMTLRRP